MAVVSASGKMAELCRSVKPTMSLLEQLLSAPFDPDVPTRDRVASMQRWLEECMESALSPISQQQLQQIMVKLVSAVAWALQTCSSINDWKKNAAPIGLLCSSLTSCACLCDKGAASDVQRTYQVLTDQITKSDLPAAMTAACRAVAADLQQLQQQEPGAIDHTTVSAASVVALGLIQTWTELAIRHATAQNFFNTAMAATVPAVVQLATAVLDVRAACRKATAADAAQPCSHSNSSTSSSGDGSGNSVSRSNDAVVVAVRLADTITALISGVATTDSMVQQLLASAELQQLLIAQLAFVTRQLWMQQQGLSGDSRKVPVPAYHEQLLEFLCLDDVVLVGGLCWTDPQSCAADAVILRCAVEANRAAQQQQQQHQQLGQARSTSSSSSSSSTGGSSHSSMPVQQRRRQALLLLQVTVELQMLHSGLDTTMALLSLSLALLPERFQGISTNAEVVASADEELPLVLQQLGPHVLDAAAHGTCSFLHQQQQGDTAGPAGSAASSSSGGGDSGLSAKYAGDVLSKFGGWLLTTATTCSHDLFLDCIRQQPALMCAVMEAGLRGAVASNYGHASKVQLILSKRTVLACEEWLSRANQQEQAAKQRQQQAQQVFSCLMTCIKSINGIVGAAEHLGGALRAAAGSMAVVQMMQQAAAAAEALIGEGTCSSSSSASSSSSSSSSSSQAPTAEAGLGCKQLQLVLLGCTLRMFGGLLLLLQTKLAETPGRAAGGVWGCGEELLLVQSLMPLVADVLAANAGKLPDVSWAGAAAPASGQELAQLQDSIIMAGQMCGAATTAAGGGVLAMLSDSISSLLQTESTRLPSHGLLGDEEETATAQAAASAAAKAQELAEALLVLGQQLQQYGEACMAVTPVSSCCNNPACTKMDKQSEQQLVAGKGTVCSKCRMARYCCKDCQVAHWKQHRRACKHHQQQSKEAAAPAKSGDAAPMDGR